MAFDLTNFIPIPAVSAGEIIASTSLTVSTAAVGVTAFPIPDTRWALFSVISQPIRVRWDGTAPTSTVGHLLFVNSAYLWPVAMFNSAQFIRDSAATGDATIFASPLRLP